MPLKFCPGVFEETPTSLNVTVGTVVEFNCSSNVTSFLSWRINDTEILSDSMFSVRLFPPEGGGWGTRLTIATRSATNMRVVCLAVDINNYTSKIQISDVAILMIEGE